MFGGTAIGCKKSSALKCMATRTCEAKYVALCDESKRHYLSVFKAITPELHSPVTE